MKPLKLASNRRRCEFNGSLFLFAQSLLCLFCIFFNSDNKLAIAIVGNSYRVFSSLVKIKQRSTTILDSYCTYFYTIYTVHLLWGISSICFILCNSSEIHANNIKHQTKTYVFCNEIVYARKKQMLPLAVNLFWKPPRHRHSHRLTKLKWCSLVIAQSFDETRNDCKWFQIKRQMNVFFAVDKYYVIRVWLSISVVVVRVR